MKYLEYTPLARVKAFLDFVDAGEYVLKGDLEAYSCKLAGVDKKLSRSLDQEVVSALAESPQFLSASPVGPMQDAASRKTLIYLILTLNHMYPDYDFSNLRPHHFLHVTPQMAKTNIDNLMMEASRVWERSHNMGSPSGTSGLLESLWTAVEEVITIADCEIYVYNSDDPEGDIFGERGSIWNFNYFFYNRKLKRILYFSCAAKSRVVAGQEMLGKRGASSDDETSQYNTDDEDLAGDMDMDEE
mmetsp:Transcript_4969/g.16204  ORF Transcript_4969/g.16204 Transcript_4969/m.16204 type:complete len:244 (+) Transcript_4969:235-966(+)